jgi:hypothetical protein
VGADQGREAGQDIPPRVMPGLGWLRVSSPSRSWSQTPRLGSRPASPLTNSDHRSQFLRPRSGHNEMLVTMSGLLGGREAAQHIQCEKALPGP